ncbi:MAG: plasmid stabilization protein, partial [Pseudolabrys sp.]
AASAARSQASRSVAAKKAAATRKRNAAHASH